MRKLYRLKARSADFSPFFSGACLAIMTMRCLVLEVGMASMPLRAAESGDTSNLGPVLRRAACVHAASQHATAPVRPNGFTLIFPAPCGRLLFAEPGSEQAATDAQGIWPRLENLAQQLANSIPATIQAIPEKAELQQKAQAIDLKPLQELLAYYPSTASEPVQTVLPDSLPVRLQAVDALVQAYLRRVTTDHEATESSGTLSGMSAIDAALRALQGSGSGGADGSRDSSGAAGSLGTPTAPTAQGDAGALGAGAGTAGGGSVAGALDQALSSFNQNRHANIVTGGGLGDPLDNPLAGGEGTGNDTASGEGYSPYGGGSQRDTAQGISRGLIGSGYVLPDAPDPTQTCVGSRQFCAQERVLWQQDEQASGGEAGTVNSGALPDVGVSDRQNNCPAWAFWCR